MLVSEIMAHYSHFLSNYQGGDLIKVDKIGTQNSSVSKFFCALQLWVPGLREHIKYTSVRCLPMSLDTKL